MAKIKRVSILGATGSVGKSTAELILANPADFAVQAVTANVNSAGLATLARRLHARMAVVADAKALPSLQQALAGSGIECFAGAEGLHRAASLPVDYIMSAIVGMAGLQPTLTAIDKGCTVAIANKEPLVAAGKLIKQAARRSGATLLPVDSEHNAIFQTLDPAQISKIRRIILTASGGPFRTLDASQMNFVTPEQAVKHPNWSMGAKISVDSATMMNKALEIIEASVLFGLPAAQIHVIVHPQSAIHGMVEYQDGSVLAQLGAADMRIPIASTLAWPDRMPVSDARLDFIKLGKMDFFEPDHEKFPALRLAYQCLAKGDAACITLNAANEVAVQAFLDRRLSFTGIVATVAAMVKKAPDKDVKTLEEILAFDDTVRVMTSDYISLLQESARDASTR